MATSISRLNLLEQGANRHGSLERGDAINASRSIQTPERGRATVPGSAAIRQNSPDLASAGLEEVKEAHRLLNAMYETLVEGTTWR